MVPVRDAAAGPPRWNGSYEELLRTSLGAGGWRSLTRSAPFATAAFTGTVGKAIAPGAILGPIPQEFPSGRFTAPPIVTVGYSDTRCTVSVTAVTTSGFNIYVRNLWAPSNSPAPGVVSWTATQMTPTSATG